MKVSATLKQQNALEYCLIAIDVAWNYSKNEMTDFFYFSLCPVSSKEGSGNLV